MSKRVRREEVARREKRKRNLIAAFSGAAVLAVGALIAVVVISSSGSGSSSKTFEPGAKVPAASIKRLDGSSLSLEKVRGKKSVIIGFFLDNCQPCIEGMRTFTEVADELRDDPVEIVAVNLGPAGPEALETFAEDIGATGYPIGEQTSGPDLAQRLGVTQVDTNVVIDKNGRVLAKQVFMPKEDQVAAARQSFKES